MDIPYVKLGPEHQSLEEQLLGPIRDVLGSGSFILGREVERFEARLAGLHELPYAVGVGSGLDALVLTLKALGVGPGDEVITVPNSFIATAAAVALVGAKPVFVDVDDEQTMSPEALAASIGARTKAIIPVHLYGRPARMEALMSHASAAGVPVVEDCAQAVGATLHGRHVGTFGVAGCYSFHPLKNLGACGDAGAVVTGDRALAERLRLLRNHGLRDRDTCVEWGYNSRLDTFQAAILLAKFPGLHDLTEGRRRHASYYLGRLKGLPIRLPRERPGENCVWHAFVIQTPQRDELRAALAHRGIEALVHYPVPIHLQPSAGHLGYGPGSFPACERQARSILSLPIRHSLREEEIERVASAVGEFFQDKRGEL